MALTVETGEGLPDADAYVSVADCEAYAVDHGLAFAGESADREARIRNATKYLDNEYTYKGNEQTDTQALSWPRTVAPGTIPRNIIAACCELACKAGDLWQDVDASAITSETIGPMSTTYAHPVNGGQVRFASVDALLRRWVTGGGVNIKVVRA